MSDKIHQELIKTTNEFLAYIEHNKENLQNDKYMYSSFLEICNVLESSIKIIETKVVRRKKRSQNKRIEVHNN